MEGGATVDALDLRLHRRRMLEINRQIFGEVDRSLLVHIPLNRPIVTPHAARTTAVVRRRGTQAEIARTVGLAGIQVKVTPSGQREMMLPNETSPDDGRARVIAKHPVEEAVAKHPVEGIHPVEAVAKHLVEVTMDHLVEAIANCPVEAIVNPPIKAASVAETRLLYRMLTAAATNLRNRVQSAFASKNQQVMKARPNVARTHTEGAEGEGVVVVVVVEEIKDKGSTHCFLHNSVDAVETKIGSKKPKHFHFVRSSLL